jgi:hypothetical protein
MPTVAATVVWDQPDATPRSLVMERVDAESNTLIATAGGYIYIETSKPVDVKLFTILGQLIERRQVDAGLHRIHIGSRGIYLVKVGAVTRRVVI